MTEIQTNGMELSSDPLADQILEIVNGATKYKVRKYFFYFFIFFFYFFIIYFIYKLR